jgi:hypothetical protein
MEDPCNLVEDWVKTVLYPQQILGHPHHQAWEDKLQSPPSSWQPPPQGWLKINVDVDVRNHKVFLAAVCRDEFGKLLYVWTDSNVKGSSTWAEAHATLLAAKEASKLQLKYVILEAHSQIVINALNQVSECSDWEIEDIVADIRSILDSSCSSWLAHFVHRDLNFLAHNLASWAADCSSRGPVTISTIPPWVFCLS